MIQLRLYNRTIRWGN